MRLIFIYFMISISVLSHNVYAQNEKGLLKIIDQEVMMQSNRGEMEWTRYHGVQPVDGYELDYSEKCEIFIRRSRNQKAIQACKTLGLLS